jgi:hypothetical protein
MGLLMASCQDSIPNISNITSDTKVVGDPNACPTGKIQKTATDGTVSCVDEPASRPDQAIKFKANFCGCKDGKAVTFGNCSSFCASKNTNGASLFYATFNVTEDISLNTSLVNVKGWCDTPLADEKTNPKCILKAKDDDNNEIIMDVDTNGAANSISANIDKLSEDKTYVLTLVESSSGSQSDSVQVIKYSADIPMASLGPLKNAPITQYTCIRRPPAPDETTGEIYYDVAFRVHFYFLPRIPPQPIQAGSDIVCHDFMNPLYGAIDDILFPRLEEIPGIFNLWDNTDPRFYDNNGNNNEDVNDLIIQKAKNFGASNIPASTKFFFKFSGMTTSADSTEAGSTSSVAQSMGFYMFPWIDQSTFRSYCLNSTHYNSSNPLFKAMRDIIGVDMEALFVGAKAPETVFDRDNKPLAAPNDFILIRETQLKKVWFYMKNGVPTVPTEAIVSTVPVFFYYPLNLASPFVKSSTQRIYQVKGANELTEQKVQEGGANSSGITTSYPPHDRKIGCIPKF